MRTCPDDLQDPGEDLRKGTVIFSFFLALYQAQVSLILTMAPQNTGDKLGQFSDNTFSLSISARKVRGSWINL